MNQGSAHQETAHYRRLTILLVGGTSAQRAAICHESAEFPVHVEPFESAIELTRRDFFSADVILAWDESEVIAQVFARLHAEAIGLPVVAIGEIFDVERIVQAMRAGALDYVDRVQPLTRLIDKIEAAYDLWEQSAAQDQPRLEAQRDLARLSARELQVLRLWAAGMSTKTLSETLQISPRTVEVHRAKIMKRLDARSSADAIRIAVLGGVDDPFAALPPRAIGVARRSGIKAQEGSENS